MGKQFSPTQNQFQSKVVAPLPSLGVFSSSVSDGRNWNSQSSENLGLTANMKANAPLTVLTCL